MQAERTLVIFNPPSKGVGCSVTRWSHNWMVELPGATPVFIHLWSSIPLTLKRPSDAQGP